MQQSSTSSILDIDVGAAFDERFHDGLMACLQRVVQCSGTTILLSIDISPVLDEKPHDELFPFF